MTNTMMLPRLIFTFVLLCTTVITAPTAHPATQPAATPAASAAASAAAASAAALAADSADYTTADGKSGDDAEPAESASTGQRVKRHATRQGSGGGNDLVSIGHDSHLYPGEKADSVVSVFGSSTSEGEAVTVVSVLGDTRVTGPVHDTAVAVIGNLYIDSKVDGDAVAVLGSVQLGPHAEVDGDVTSVFGAVHRAQQAIVRGDVHDVFLGEIGDVDWLHTWIHRCLFEARPLAFVAGVEWAWSIAFVFLALYLVLGLLFPSPIRQCVNTLDTQPGRSALAALLAMLLTPVLLVLLCVTVIGVAAVPFVVITLLALSLFGKAVALAWMGHRVVGHRTGAASNPAVAVLIGGAIALLLYVIPVVGFLAYKLLGFFGVGAVVYTLLMGQRARQASRTERANGERPYATAPATDAAAVAGAAAAPVASAVGSTAADAAGNTAAGTTAAGTTTAGSTAAGSGASGDAGPGAGNPEPTPQVLAALPRAGFWLRMGALLLDVLLIGILTRSGGYLLEVFPHHSDLHLLVLAVYGACMWKLRGSTVGGIVCDLRVVRLDGRPIEWETAIVRALGCFLSLAVCGLGFIWIALDANHQAWHDKIAGTVVVRVPKVRPLV